MKILMIAPEPCFQPRGTPFSVYHRCAALTGLGHKIDLATYHLGNDVEMEGLRIRRAWGPRFASRVKVGPSYTKFLLDILLALRVVGLLVVGRYDVVHTHEEAGVLGALLRMLGIPHVYDMHSDLGQQLTNFQFTRNRFLIGLMDRVQRWIIRRADTVIVICPDLARRVEELVPGKRVALIENTSMMGEAHTPTREDVERLRQEFGLQGKRVLLYTGTMETYQGLGALVESIPQVVSQEHDVVYLLVGGQPGQIAELEALAESLGVREHVVFTGVRPSHEMWAFNEVADVLLSPRLHGTNTPLKIYAYLHSGRPIVATDLLTHTQVLSSETAMLVSPTAEGLAKGALRLLKDPALGAQLAAQAQQVASAKYTYEAFVSKTNAVYQEILSPSGKAP